jgi:arylamine N-acetyltransferase
VSSTAYSQTGFERYLRLLGIEESPSGLAGLRTLVRRHLATVPFENVSKLLLYAREGAGRPTTFEEFLDGIEFSDLGGTCYTCNALFAELLRYLGYDADLLGADMSKPDVHVCVRVRVDSAAYIVDVGFAAPFREPMPLDRLPFEVREGNNRYVLEADGDRFRMDLFSGDKFAFSYVAHDPPRTREQFAPTVAMSYALTSTFMTSLRISRVFDAYSLDLIGRRLYRHEAGETTVTELATLADLKAAMAGPFQMPRCPVESAIAAVEGITNRPYFG